MMNILRNNYRAVLFALILIYAACIRLYDLFREPLYTWDGSVYIGIGKSLFSGGVVGLEEVFRPIFLALIQGSFWKLGIDPIIGGGIVVSTISLILLICVYKMGEDIHENAGLFASLMLGFTPIVLLYSHIPMSDVFASALVLIGLYATLRKQFFLSGVLLACAFLSRFPHGLGLIVACISIALFHFKEHRFTHISKLLKEWSIVFLGFLILIVPYFIWSHHTYGDMFTPLREGMSVIGHSPHVYHRGPWFYLTSIIGNNPLYLFLFGGIGVCVTMGLYKREMPKPLILALLGFFIYFTYFSFEAHKELRYSIATLPFLALIAGLGLAAFSKIVHYQKALTIGIVISGVIFLTHQYYTFLDPAITSARHSYYSFFDSHPKGTTLIATEPMSVARGDTRLIAPLYDSWKYALEIYTARKEEAQYISLDSCVLESACSVDTTCYEGKEELLTILKQEGREVFNEVDRSCELRIYDLTR